MMDFKQWWSEQEFFGGEGCMDAAELAWDYKDEQIQSLQSTIEKQKAALEFYADERIYPDWDDSEEPIVYEILDDKGTKAREVLSEVEG